MLYFNFFLYRMNVFHKRLIFGLMLSNGPRSLPGCSDLLHHSFLLELLLYSERYGLLLAARHIREELLDTGEDGADDPLLLLCLEEAEADDEVEVEDGVVEVVEVGLKRQEYKI